MMIKRASYLLTAVKTSQFPTQQLPAVTLLGRSNVGKSSLINTLCNRRGMARTSSQPGKTRTINFYLIDDSWYLVDLPGYGYAKVSKTAREEWRQMVNDYLLQYQGARIYWQLVDIRHEPSVQDIEMWAWLQQQPLPCRLIATKADKISRGARDKHLAMICRALQVKKQDVIVFSSVDRTGKEELLQIAADFLA